MKAKKCKVIVNTKWGYCCSPVECKSIAEAVRLAKESCGFAYRVYDENSKLVRKGFC